MSWDQILSAFGGKPSDPNAPPGTPQPTAPANPNPEMGATPNAPPQQTPGIGQQIGNTLLGNAPRTDSIPGFVNDTLKGATNPHGLIGQAVRLVGAIAAFGHSPQMGLQYLTMLDASDKGERTDLAEAAARGWTPQEYEARTGRQVPTDVGTALQARDAAPGGPSLPDRVNAIQFPNTPEELTAARDAELKYSRALPTFGEGFSRPTAVQQAELAQRQNLPLGASEKTALTEEALNSVPSGQYTGAYTAGDEGMKAVLHSIPPPNQSMTMETFNSTSVPPGFVKLSIPDPTNPGQVFMEIRNERGQNPYEWISNYAAATNRDPYEVWKEVTTSRGAGKAPKLGSTEASLQAIQMGIGRRLTEDEIFEYKALRAKAEKELKPGQAQEEFNNWLIKVGYMPDPNEIAAREEKAQLYEGIAKKEEPQPSGPPTPGANQYQTPTPAGRPGFGGTPNPNEPSPSPIAPNFPPIVPRGYPLPSEAKQKSPAKYKLRDLTPENISFFTSKVMDKLTETGDPNEAGRYLAEALGETELSDPEKRTVIESVVESLELPETVKRDVLKSTIKGLK